MRCDVDGNLWCGWGMGDEKLDGVAIFNPDGKQIGRIALPARCPNVCFGGTYRNRLFMCGSTAMYALTSTPRAHLAAEPEVPRAGSPRAARPIRPAPLQAGLARTGRAAFGGPPGTPRSGLEAVQSPPERERSGAKPHSPRRRFPPLEGLSAGPRGRL